VPVGLLTSKPTWLDTFGCSTTSVFFAPGGEAKQAASTAVGRAKQAAREVVSKAAGRKAVDEAKEVAQQAVDKATGAS